MQLALRLEVDEDTGDMHPADKMFAEYAPDAHLSEDLFKTKLAFAALLIFPAGSLEERLKKGRGWTRLQWAQSRLAQSHAFRVPSGIIQQIAKTHTAAQNYINSYNIFMDNVTCPDNKPLFRQGLRLISHWGLRDELKALYASPAENLLRQKTICAVMERIITQEIPQEAVNSRSKLWNPAANTLDGQKAQREPDTRYRHLLEIFLSHKAKDRYYPDYPSHIDRKFKLYCEIPEPEVKRMLIEILTAPEGKKIADFIKRRLKRDLEPFDIWYDSFKMGNSLPEEELDRIASEKYPTLEKFQDDLPAILGKLGFDHETARFLAERIEADPARGAGHAWGPCMRTEKAHLRTRIQKNGMDYQGFNAAMHELGHCVEQIFSIYKIDHTLLEGVPNTALTEGFAFVFQSRDLDILGVEKPQDKAEESRVLDTFWSAREIAGVSLVDMAVWHWLYENPSAKPEQLKSAVIKIAKNIWNSYYAPVFGVKDSPIPSLRALRMGQSHSFLKGTENGSVQTHCLKGWFGQSKLTAFKDCLDSPILAVYSHMICHALYLPDYPLGYIIAFQIENYFKDHPLAGEMERMCGLGSLTPAEWMRQAIGERISPKPLIRAAQSALKTMQDVF